MRKIIFIPICVISFSLLAGKIFDSGYKKFWSPVFDKLDVVYKDHSKKDIVFAGDSRTLLGINPYYIDSVTRLNSFNIGMGGAAIDEVYLLTQSWLKNHPAPKLFVVTVSYAGMGQDRKFFKNPCYYFYYSSGDDTLMNTINRLHYHGYLFKYFPPAKFSAFDEYDKISLLRSFKGDRLLLPGGISYKGFFNNGNASGFKIDNNAFFIDSPNVSRASFSTGLKKFKDLLAMIHRSGSGCIITYPPATNFKYMHSNPLCDFIDSTILRAAATYHMPVIHYDTAFSDSHFQDPWHLNIEGAAAYSRKTGEDIKKILQSSYP